MTKPGYHQRFNIIELSASEMTKNEEKRFLPETPPPPPPRWQRAHKTREKSRTLRFSAQYNTVLKPRGISREKPGNKRLKIRNLFRRLTGSVHFKIQRPASLAKADDFLHRTWTVTETVADYEWLLGFQDQASQP